MMTPSMVTQGLTGQIGSEPGPGSSSSSGPPSHGVSSTQNSGPAQVPQPLRTFSSVVPSQSLSLKSQTSVAPGWTSSSPSPQPSSPPQLTARQSGPRGQHS